jgi:hypothetical protein
VGVGQASLFRNLSLKNFNICVIDFPHAMAWAELAQLICFSLRELGYGAQIRRNKLENDCRNILIGAFLLPPDAIKQVPRGTIFLNTEQLKSDAQSSWWPSDIFDWARCHPTWDYSDTNINEFNNRGIFNVKKLNVGYQRELVRIPKSLVQDIDVLFYGTIEERREKILNELAARGLNIRAAFNVYGRERDHLISRAKVVLNMHHFKSCIFEVVRVFYLVTNSKAVVAEVGERTSVEERFLRCVEHTTYEELTDVCVALVRDSERRTELERNSNERFSAYKQTDYMRALISDT